MLATVPWQCFSECKSPHFEFWQLIKLHGSYGEHVNFDIIMSQNIYPKKINNHLFHFFSHCSTCWSHSSFKKTKFYLPIIASCNAIYTQKTTAKSSLQQLFINKNLLLRVCCKQKTISCNATYKQKTTSLSMLKTKNNFLQYYL